MLLFNVTYVESAEDEKGPEYVPDPNDARKRRKKDWF